VSDRFNLSFVTEPPRAYDSLEQLHAELGPRASSLRIQYRLHYGNWLRTERTYTDGRPTSDEFDVLVHDPVHDLISKMTAWGGPVDILVTGLEPDELAEILRPATHQVSMQINGQTFTS